jgi:hypothetical protein
MARPRSSVDALVAGLLLLAGATAAYHSTAHHSMAMWDESRRLTLNGTIKRFEWTNPHAWIWFVADGAAADTWGVEGGAPNSMRRQGWTRDALKPGDKVIVTLRPRVDSNEREVPRVGALVAVTKADGTSVPTTSATVNSSTTVR